MNCNNNNNLFLQTVSVILSTSVTISLKLVDRQNVSPSAISQAFLMFFGEFICLIVFLILRKSNKELFSYSYLFIAPAVLDIVSTIMKYTGIKYIDISNFQIIKSSVIPFTFLLSIVFLKKIPRNNEIFGILSIIVGIVIIGVSGSKEESSFSSQRSSIELSKKTSSSEKVFYGNMLVLCAQFLTSIQLIYEEYTLKKGYSSRDTFDINSFDELFVVGMEGLIAIIIITISMVFYEIFNRGSDISETIDRFQKELNNDVILAICICGIFVVPSVNYVGMKITKNMTAGHRTILDIICTIVVSLFSYAIGWESRPSYMKLFGFFTVFIGTYIYNIIETVHNDDLYIPIIIDSEGSVDSSFDRISSNEQPIEEIRPHLIL